MIQLHTNAAPQSADTSAQTEAEELNMNQVQAPEVVEHPMTGEEVYEGSLRGLLARNLGYYIVASFLIGTQQPVAWEGILNSVGNDYIVIYQPDQDRYVTGDLYALKFVEFHNSKAMPSPCSGCPGYRRRDGNRIW
ncbi:MAG: hypothetical protein GXW99_05905 [Clostridiales bacterium]|nr:hypothetical protein [Clostridiales bacterium]